MSGSPPASGDQDRGPAIMAIVWTQGAISTLVVAIRFAARISIMAVGMDDWVMLFTLINFIVFNIVVTIQALHGGDRHLFYIPPDKQSFILKLSEIGQPFAIMAICLAKISVAFLLLRIIGPGLRWPRYFLYFTMISSLTFTSLDIIFTFVQCSPVKALWDPTITHTCWNPKVQTKFAIFTASWLVIIDAALAILPIFIFGRLQMSMQKKIGVCLLLGCGIIAAICGAIKTGYLNEFNSRSDITWVTYNAYVWSSSEIFVLIICGSIPPMKILHDKLTMKVKTKKSKGSYTRSYGTSDSFPLKSIPVDKKEEVLPSSEGETDDLGVCKSDIC